MHIKIIISKRNPFLCDGWFHAGCLQFVIGMGGYYGVKRAVEVIDHEMTHAILFKEISINACGCYDNLDELSEIY